MGKAPDVHGGLSVSGPLRVPLGGRDRQAADRQG